MSATDDPVTVTLTEHARSIRDGMRALVGNLRLPERFTQPDAVRPPDDFDVNAYFTCLEHLAVKDGYCLDWVYFSDELGGRPQIYARPKGQEGFRTYREYLFSIGERQTRERSYGALPHAFDYLALIKVDDSPEGFLELSALALLGDQFYLAWHGLYHDAFIVCSGEDIKPDMNGLDGFGLALPDPVLAAARRQDFAVTVRMGATSATVRLAVFSKWGGLVEYQHEHARSFPHRLVNVRSHPLVEYECGVSF